MKYQQQRNKLFKMFILLGIAFFLLINFGHWLNYRPVKSRIDNFVKQEIKTAQVSFLSYIEHNARLKEILMLKLDGIEEAVPMILENDADLEKLINTVDNKVCSISKVAYSYEINFQCDQRITVQLKNLTKTAWLGGIKYAIIGGLLVIFIGFITSRKMSDEKFADNFV